MRDPSPYLISQDTKTPLTDVLKISRTLDSFHNTGLPELDEKCMLGLFYRFATEEESYLIEKDASSKFIQWFNETKIKIFIEDEMSDEQYIKLEKIWQDVK